MMVSGNAAIVLQAYPLRRPDAANPYDSYLYARTERGPVNARSYDRGACERHVWSPG